MVSWSEKQESKRRVNQISMEVQEKAHPINQLHLQQTPILKTLLFLLFNFSLSLSNPKRTLEKSSLSLSLHLRKSFSCSFCIPPCLLFTESSRERERRRKRRLLGICRETHLFSRGKFCDFGIRIWCFLLCSCFLASLHLSDHQFGWLFLAFGFVSSVVCSKVLEMGACWSNRIKAVTPSNTGLNSKSASRDGNNFSSSSSKVSSASTPQTPRSEGEILESSNLKSFTFSELRNATRNFRPDSVLGEGGFGSVFKGWIDENSLTATKPGTGIVIAVKRLNQEGFQGHKEWLAEINYLGQLHHPNLVKLIGYCFEDEHRLLVYEFMPRGSMENHLFRRGSRFQPLSWGIRMKVALGAARGLAFLHNAETKVIYRDFKTSNILLDTHYNAKLSDFGLARDGPTGDKSHVSTRVMGTYGYAAPEYLATGHLTAKSDVYSFGVVLLEMLSGRRAIDKNRPSGEHNLVEWARPYLINKRRSFRIMDTRLEGQYSMSKAQKAANLALQCLAGEAKYRPNMDEVVAALEQLQDSKEMPKSSPKPHQNGYSKPALRSHRKDLGDGAAKKVSYPRPSPLYA